MSLLVRKALQSAWRKVGKADAARIATQTPTPGVTQTDGLPYLDGGNKMHQLNLYRPEGTQGPLPTVIDIHGGGWLYGDCDLNRNYCRWIAAQGCSVMGMSYRLLPNTDLKGQVQDIFASLHWLAANGSAYGFNLSQVLLTGDSAGGFFTGLVACIAQSPRLQALYGVAPLPYGFTALGILHGVCDLPTMQLAPGWVGAACRREMLRMMFGKDYETAPLFAASSFRDTAVGLSLPPTIVLSSEADPLHTQAQLQLQLLAHMGLPHRGHIWPLAGHEKLQHVFSICYPEWPESQFTTREMLDYFEQNSVPRSEPAAHPPKALL